MNTTLIILKRNYGCIQVEFFTQSNCKSKANPYMDRCSGTMDDKYFGGHPVPKTYIPYEAVVKDKFRYQTITFMKVRSRT